MATWTFPFADARAAYRHFEGRGHHTMLSDPARWSRYWCKVDRRAQSIPDEAKGSISNITRTSPG
jgi:hypothetical protein